MITGPVRTISGTPAELSPVALFLSVTVNVPTAARVACPDTCVVLPPALTLHGVGVHPGPLKKTVEFDALKFDPVSVIVKGCPTIGGLGEGVI